MESPFDDLGVILDRIAAGECSETDVTTLRRMLFIGGEQNVVQVGKYNVRIGQGQDIQIGDRIYQGADADAIQRILEPIVLQLREDMARLRQELLARLQGHGLTEEAAALPLDLRRHFDRLLQDYTFFGGRVNELATIESFLAEPQGGYLFVTGPSGYGKTALLVQMARQGNVVYHFLSRAYGTVDEDLFLRNLCRQLAARRGLGGQLPASIAELRALYPDLLRLPPAVNQPVVVLVDGLDEALNWGPGPQHFPPDLPNGVKVIFSGRQVADHDWPDHLRLPLERVQRLVLGAMTTHDLAALLRAASGAVAPLAEDGAWIEQALQVSGGDPFYLKLLVEDLRDGRMQPGQIGEQPVGLDAYLRSWWNQVAGAVRARDVRDLLGTLAIARGRLQRDDLTAMFPDLGWALDGVLTEVRRFVIGGEQEGYTLCHPRFADYVRRRVGPRALETYTSALLTYCANWREHRSPYALQHLSDHLLETERFRELVDLINRPFLSAKARYFRSYTGILHDLRNAVHAARAIRDPAKMLGLALVHSGLQTKLVQLAAYDVIPLYARLGEPERALEFAESIGDETQRAKTLVAVAREVLSSEPERARQLVRRVLADWRQYPTGYECGSVLREVLSLLPGELIAFLEALDDLTPVDSLGNCTYFAYQAVDQAIPQLEPGQQERLRMALTMALSLPGTERARSDLRFLLARLEPDPVKAKDFADNEAARIIVRAKQDGQEQPDGQLTDQTIEQTIQILLTDRLTYDERWALLYFVVAPHAQEFASAISKSQATGNKVCFLLDAALALAEIGQDAEGAKTLLLEALSVNAEVPDNWPFDEPPISKGCGRGGFDELLRRIGEGIAEESLGDALDFLDGMEQADIPGWDEGRCRACAVGAAAMRDPQSAWQIAIGPWHHHERYQDRAKAMIAEHVAETDLEWALSIWRELDPDYVDKQATLVTILRNAAPSSHTHAREVLESEFQPEQKYQLYKVPVLLEAAARLKESNAEQAEAIAQKTMDAFVLGRQFEEERWSRPEKEFFLVSIIPALAVCGLTELARGLIEYRLTDHLGLKAIAAADMLCLLADDYVAHYLADYFEHQQKCEAFEKMGRPDLAEGLRGKRRHTLQELIEGERTIPSLFTDLHFILSQPRHWGDVGLRQFAFEIVDYVELSSTTKQATLTSLYLGDKAWRHLPEWDPDHVKALLAAKTVSVYGSSALYFASQIEGDEIRQLALVDLCAKLPLEALSRKGKISRHVLKAIAFARQSAKELSQADRLECLKEAFNQAERSLGDPLDEFTLDLLLEFVRETGHLDPEQAGQFSGRLVASVLGLDRDWAAHRLLELVSCGSDFSPDQAAAIERLSDQRVHKLEHLAEDNVPGQRMTEQQARRLGGERLILVARSTLPYSRRRGLQIVDSAARQAAMITEPSTRLLLRCGILRCLLAVGDADLLEEAIVRAIDYDDAIFHTFQWFGHTLLDLMREDTALPVRLLETIDWAEDLMRV